MSGPDAPTGFAASSDGRIPIIATPYAPPAGPAPRVRRQLQPRRWLAWAGGLAAAAVLGFLLLAGSVVVRVAPDLQPDRVDFVGTAFDFGFRDRHLVWPGRYTVAVELEGYEPGSVDVDVSGDAGQRVLVALVRLPGQVTIDSGGIDGELYVDGVRVGAVPGTHALRAGARDLRIEASRFATWRGKLDVTGGGERQQLQVKLDPAFAGLTVESIPAGAVVRANGRELGTTPVQAELDAGRYQLSITHPDYRAWTAPITIRPGQPLKIGPVELGLPDGTLSVRTQPTGADVSIGGRYRGRTPLAVALPPGVAHDVVISLAGHASVSRSVEVASRSQRVLDVPLAAVFGEVTVRGEPGDAELVVNGVSRGRTGQTLRLPAAPQAIEVRKAGLEPFRTTVVPREGLVQVVEYTLRSPSEARAARFSGTVRSSTGIELKLVSGGRYVSGSARREPGRRSNETQRTIELKRPFYLGVREVTNAEYRQFKSDHMTGALREETLDKDRQPVGNVTWNDAAAFCNWLSEKDKLPPAYVRKDGGYQLVQPATTGYRLPTEAEWEFVARHDGTAAARKYPWGDELPPPARSGNYADQRAIYLTPTLLANYDDGERVSANVGSYAANPLGFHDLGGNVAEWTHDLFTIYVPGPGEVAVDPVGPADGAQHVVRGASFLTGRVAELRLAWREPATGKRQDVGFRVARYAE